MGELLREFLHEITADRSRFLAEFVQSLILLAILGWAGRKAARKRLDARRARIVAELAEAEQAERDVGRLYEEVRSRGARAREEAPALLREAEAKAQQEREAAIGRIEAEAKELIGQAHQAVERDKTRVTRESAGRLVELTAEATRRYLDEMLTESERRALTQKAILASLAELSGSPSLGAGGS
jgi:F0F1-type ATP synthase membrane subunit b/b'